MSGENFIRLDEELSELSNRKANRGLNKHNKTSVDESEIDMFNSRRVEPKERRKLSSIDRKMSYEETRQLIQVCDLLVLMVLDYEYWEYSLLLPMRTQIRVTCHQPSHILAKHVVLNQLKLTL